MGEEAPGRGGDGMTGSAETRGSWRLAGGRVNREGETERLGTGRWGDGERGYEKQLAVGSWRLAGGSADGRESLGDGEQRRWGEEAQGQWNAGELGGPLRSGAGVIRRRGMGRREVAGSGQLAAGRRQSEREHAAGCYVTIAFDRSRGGDQPGGISPPEHLGVGFHLACPILPPGLTNALQILGRGRGQEILQKRLALPPLHPLDSRNDGLRIYLHADRSSHSSSPPVSTDIAQLQLHSLLRLEFESQKGIQRIALARMQPMMHKSTGAGPTNPMSMSERSRVRPRALEPNSTIRYLGSWICWRAFFAR